MEQLIEGKYRYFAFISYKREDERWAKWLQHRLEHYKLPTNLNGRTDLPQKIRPIFKDTSELIPGNLPAQISEALSLSKHLIVICSPRAVQSEWVNKEIEHFTNQGKVSNIIPFIVDGTPFSRDPEQECFPQAIRQIPKEQELLGANINEAGREAAAVKVVAKMFEIQFDELWHRHEREQRRRKIAISASVAAVMLFLVGIAFWMYLQKNETQRANWRMLENQARMIAEKSKSEVSKGNIYDAILAILETIPHDNERPFVIESEEALRFAYNSFLSNEWNYRFIGSNYNNAYFSDDEKYIICITHGAEQSVVEIFDTKSLQLVSQITSNDRDDWEWPACVFPSADSDTLYVSSEETGVLCFDVSTGNFLGKKPWTSSFLERCFTYNLDQFNDDIHELFWKKEVKESIAFPPNATTVYAYSPINDLILFEQPDENGEDAQDLVSYNLYDCNTHQIIKKFDNQGLFYSFGDSNDLNRASFSRDGNYLAMAFRDGKGKIINLSDFSEKQFNCGNEDCCHYSSWLLYARNNDLLHSSMFEHAIKRYDRNSLELLDSIVSNNQTFYFTDIGYADMVSDGSTCLLQDYSGYYIYYHTNDKKENYSYENTEPFENEYVSDTILDNRYKIVASLNGVSFSDSKNEVKSWSLNDPKIAYNIYGFIHDNKYMLLSKEGFRGASTGIDVVDLMSGTIVEQVEGVMKTPQTGDIIFSRTREKEDGEYYEEFDKFVSFEELVTLCRQVTAGMSLSEAAKRKFFLN